MNNEYDERRPNLPKDAALAGCDLEALISAVKNLPTSDDDREQADWRETANAVIIARAVFPQLTVALSEQETLPLLQAFRTIEEILNRRGYPLPPLSLPEETSPAAPPETQNDELPLLNTAVDSFITPDDIPSGNC